MSQDYGWTINRTTGAVSIKLNKSGTRRQWVGTVQRVGSRWIAGAHTFTSETEAGEYLAGLYREVSSC